MIHNVGIDKQGLSLGCYDSANPTGPSQAKYFLNVLTWPKKT